MNFKENFKNLLNKQEKVNKQQECQLKNLLI